MQQEVAGRSVEAHVGRDDIERGVVRAGEARKKVPRRIDDGMGIEGSGQGGGQSEQAK